MHGDVVAKPHTIRRGISDSFTLYLAAAGHQWRVRWRSHSQLDSSRRRPGSTERSRSRTRLWSRGSWRSSLRASKRCISRNVRLGSVPPVRGRAVRRRDQDVWLRRTTRSRSWIAARGDTEEGTHREQLETPSADVLDRTSDQLGREAASLRTRGPPPCGSTPPSRALTRRRICRRARLLPRARGAVPRLCRRPEGWCGSRHPSLRLIHIGALNTGTSPYGFPAISMNRVPGTASATVSSSPEPRTTS
jgi:hypothetical protein